MRRQYLAFGLAIFAVAIVVCVESISLVIWTPIGPGPGFFTVILGAVLGLLALAVMWDQRRQGETDGAQPRQSEEASEADPAPRRRFRRPARVWLVVGALVVIPFVLEPLGFRLTILALVLYVLLFVERRRVVSSVLIAAGASALSFYVFADLLAVPLPVGLLGV
ncbi:tripartite tricarboxylate transporter TctB family protein [Saccharopolyspora sp. ASAGF58]|uniref:tripartite tricarboxylate transporter TctB family protein n=1 Tax=Saccharopolyspora sp. ASAGF58 TaxID=2719023 RepID=UPI0014401E72|nr:tripartite tricarboxylate transporter TctB family protein [Saccharopolyspora sp. ASAGF58]QIZ38606.1 tripartite tricarboxylate transporter TctB family protein [Saccharopolyspora sp. ASAGF58]